MYFSLSQTKFDLVHITDGMIPLVVVPLSDLSEHRHGPGNTNTFNMGARLAGKKEAVLMEDWGGGMPEEEVAGRTESLRV
jgi:hypothetical protein